MCDFCPSTKDIVTKNNLNTCHTCRSVSKKCKKASGLYYDVALGTYVEGDAIRHPDGKAMVFDLHNVADVFELTEFAELVRPLFDHYVWIGLLSFVGSTTPIRTEADKDIKQRMALIPGLHGYLCFRRNEHALPGTKGGFIQSLDAQHVVFFDDGADHVASAIEAGAVAHFISRKSSEARLQLKQLISHYAHPK